MNNPWFKQWVEEEYIRLILLADQLLGKEKLVDFYYSKTLPPREEANLLIPNLIPQLEKLLKTAKKRLPDSASYYPRTIFEQQISTLKTRLELESEPTRLDYAQTVELLLGVKLFEPDWRTLQETLKHSLKAAGYKGSLHKMLAQWQAEGRVDVFSFMQEARAMLPWLWDEVCCKILPSLLSDEEIDFLQEKSEVKFFHMNNLWEDWPYYGGYHNVYMSMIALNARLGWNRFEVKTFLAHEGLPGRHLFWLLRQRSYDLGQSSHINMLATFASPESLVQEGIIACAHEFLWPEGLALPKEQVALEYWRLRRAVGLLAAIKLYQEQEEPEQVQKFVQEQALLPPGRAQALIGIIQEHPYHYPAFQLGYEFVRQLWQAYGEEFWLEFSHYRCPLLLQRLYPLPASAKGEKIGG